MTRGPEWMTDEECLRVSKTMSRTNLGIALVTAQDCLKDMWHLSDLLRRLYAATAEGLVPLGLRHEVQDELDRHAAILAAVEKHGLPERTRR
ncbi:MAG: hypothetical protein ACPGQD_05610 [Planctomycetota bacterium]